MINSTSDGNGKFQKQAFSILVKNEKELSGIRREYASKSKSERRKAADWEYHSEISGDLFSNLLAIKEEGFGRPYWPAAFISLAIDPLYAPAILTVGSLEYQVGRIKKAMKLFLTLTKLPENEEDLSTIIDKAGDFLIDSDDLENALKLFTAAERMFPDNTLYIIGSGYCLGELGRHMDSVKKHRRAVEVEPDNYMHLNDLGYSLLEAEKFDESEQVLKKAISLAPEDYEYPHTNLEELMERKSKKS